MLAEIDEVGGADESIDRVGVLNRVGGGCPDETELARSRLDTAVVCSREEVRRGSKVAGPDPYGGEDVLDDNEGKDHEDA